MIRLATRHLDRAEVSTIELNLSCPNVDAVEEPTAEIVEAARAETAKPLYAKLSPAVPDVATVAIAARDAGADGLAMLRDAVINLGVGDATVARAWRRALETRLSTARRSTRRTGATIGPARRPPSSSSSTW